MSAPFITGQVLMRNMGEKDGRTVFMLVGLVAVPQGQEWLDGHQYPVLSFNNMQLTLDTTKPIDRSQETKGMTAEQILMTPMWRV